MQIKNFQITSPSALDLELTVTKPVCVLYGRHSALVLDLLRELIGDSQTEDDPDRFDDGRFVICSDLEIDGKAYSVCYIRNADFMGDNRIAANFVLNGREPSKDDTVEFVEQCNRRDRDFSNVFTDIAPVSSEEDDRPVFVYLSACADKEAALAFLVSLAKAGRQVFVAVPPCGLSFHHAELQSLSVG